METRQRGAANFYNIPRTITKHYILGTQGKGCPQHKRARYLASAKSGEGSDSRGRNQGVTIAVGDCTNRDFHPPKRKTVEDVEPPCRSIGDESMATRPRECKSERAGPPIYDETCVRPYVNPCDPFPGVKPCMPQNQVTYRTIQPCGHPNIMDVCPIPDCPYDNTKSKAAIRNRILSLLSLLIAGGVIYKIWLAEQNKKQLVEIKKESKRTLKRPQVIIKNPETSEEIPDEVPYLLIGGGTASYSACGAIRNADKDAKILVITSEPYTPYMRPPLSKSMWFNEDRKKTLLLQFMWKGDEKSIFYETEDFYTPCMELLESDGAAVAIARGWTVKGMDVANRTVTLEDGKVIKYGKCLLAPGAKPRNLPLLDKATDDIQEKVTLFRGVFDFQELEEIVADGAQSIAIVGNGILGTELACALAKVGKPQGLKITQIFKEDGPLQKILPQYLSKWAMGKVEQEGVKVFAKTQVEDVLRQKKTLRLLLSNGRNFLVDHVIVAVGVDPNTELAGTSELETDPEYGGFLVNAELEARSNLYVAGDCASFYDVQLGRRRIEHHDNAVISGILAGENMTGSTKAYWNQSMFSSFFGADFGYQVIGLVDSSLPTVGVFPKKTVEGDNAEETNSQPQDYRKGVIFYLRDDIIVGVVLWNLPDGIDVARDIIKREKTYDDINVLSEKFHIHE